MKRIFAMTIVFALMLASGCSWTETSQPASPQPPQAAQPTDAPPSDPPAEQPAGQQPQEGNGAQASPDKEDAQVYANERFRNVTVRKTAEDTYEVTGQARVFEATLNYVVEDGHNELAEGHATASKGAPEWGDFTFTVTVKKERPNSTLTLILFEESPKDGSRQYQLFIPLPE